jgi:hypothetical protein
MHTHTHVHTHAHTHMHTHMHLGCQLKRCFFSPPVNTQKPSSEHRRKTKKGAHRPLHEKTENDPHLYLYTCTWLREASLLSQVQMRVIFCVL